MTSENPGRGMLIAFEGIDGTGKSTQAARLVTRLEEAGLPVVATREPTRGEWGQRIRRLAREGRDNLSPEDELDWFLRDRKENVEQVIRPALGEDKIVVTDRYYFSTMAYQGALGIDPIRIKEMNEALFPRPDLILLLHVDPAVGLDRIERGRRHGTEEAYEKEGFLARVADLYESFEDPAIRRIDAAGAAHDVEREIWSVVEPFLERAKRPGGPRTPAA